jgi:hypothetical protein
MECPALRLVLATIVLTAANPAKADCDPIRERGFVRIPMEIAKGIVAIPAETVRVQPSQTARRDIAAAERAMLKAQRRYGRCLDRARGKN